MAVLLLICMAAMKTEGRGCWEEMVDPRYNGDYDLEELNGIATIAYKCMNQLTRQRPSMRDVVQALSRLYTAACSRRHRPAFSLTMEDASVEMCRLEGETCHMGMQIQESMEETAVDTSHLKTQIPNAGFQMEELIHS